MNDNLIEAAQALVERAAALEHHGRVADRAEWERINHDLGGRIPDWYRELLSRVPLGGLNLGWRTAEPTAEFEGVEWVIWANPSDLRSESLEAYPGLAILERGYINVALDATGGGDPYFIPTDQGDNPPLYQVCHDISDEADVILQHGRRLVAQSLSVFFSQAIIIAP